MEEAANRAAEEQLRHSLAQIHDELEAMLAGQLAVNEAAVKRAGGGPERTARKRRSPHGVETGSRTGRRS